MKICQLVFKPENEVSFYMINQIQASRVFMCEPGIYPKYGALKTLFQFFATILNLQEQKSRFYNPSSYLTKAKLKPVRNITC